MFLLGFRIVAKERLGINKKELIDEVTLLIEKYPDQAEFYNVRSNLYRSEKQYLSALNDAYKAIDLKPENGLYYSTLAEIRFCQGEKQEFYLNFDTALRMDYNIEDILFEVIDTKNIYRQSLTDPEFIRILHKHDKSYFIDLLQKDRV